MASQALVDKLEDVIENLTLELAEVRKRNEDLANELIEINHENAELRKERDEFVRLYKSMAITAGNIKADAEALIKERDELQERIDGGIRVCVERIANLYRFNSNSNKNALLIMDRDDQL